MSISDQSIANPWCIILVKNGSKGDRLLFKYPFRRQRIVTSTPKKVVNNSFLFGESPSAGNVSTNKNNTSSFLSSDISDNVFSTSPSVPIYRKTSRSSPPTPRKNPYSMSKYDDVFVTSSSFHIQEEAKKASNKDMNAILNELSDKDLSNLLAVNSELAERKFELKLNDVRFVGHPTLMHNPRDIRPLNPKFETSVKLFHVVFCLNASASHSIVKCFFDLSKRLGIGLRHEEYRCGFLNSEMKSIIAMHDEACTDHIENNAERQEVLESVFEEILTKSKLAQLLTKVYDDVCRTGYVFAKINDWVQISFCLPHRIHVLPFRNSSQLVEPEKIHQCLEAIRPYHAILLLVTKKELLGRLYLDASPSIPRVLQVYSPVKSLQTIAADADLTLSQVVEVASHLVYWALATVIYPMCETNVYVIAPDVPSVRNTELVSAFASAFPGLSLSQTFADFSLPMPLGERIHPVLNGSYQQSELIKLVTWMLKQRFLVQLHTYIYLSTYLDGIGNDVGLDHFTVNVNPDISLNLSIRPYEHDSDYDDVTASDSYSETTADDLIGISPLPSVDEPGALNHGSRRVDSEGDDVGKAQQTNNNVESIEPLEKFKMTLNELNDAVKRAVNMTKTPVSIQDIKMFARLSRYFNGEFHLEEIMYRENVRRSQLLLLLDKFRDALITVEKPDSDINFFKFESEMVSPTE